MDMKVKYAYDYLGALRRKGQRKYLTQFLPLPDLGQWKSQVGNDEITGDF